MFYKLAALCAVVAYASAQRFIPPSPPLPYPNRGSEQQSGSGLAHQGGYNNAGLQKQGMQAAFEGAQGSQGSEGAQAFGGAFENANAGQAAGRYDHAASLLAASDRTSAAAEQSFGSFGNGAAFGKSQGADGWQAGGAMGRQSEGLEAAGHNNAQQNHGQHQNDAASNNRYGQGFYGGYGLNNPQFRRPGGFGNWFGYNAPYNGYNGYKGGWNNAPYGGSWSNFAPYQGSFSSYGRRFF